LFNSLFDCLVYPEMVAECDNFGAGGRLDNAALIGGNVADE
jgi:hypothetical protein